MVALIILALVFFAYKATAYVNENNAVQNPLTFTASVAHADILTPAAIEGMKDDIINQLAKCESGGKSETDGITVLDTNGVGSYGALQWQKRSVMHYYKQMTGTEINGRDAIIYAMTPDKARTLAKYVIFDTAAGVENDWVNCNIKLGLQKQIDLIKRHTN